MPSEAARQQHRAPADLRISEEPRPARSQLEWLIDNGEAYESLVSAIQGARESIWISQLAFDADCSVYGSDDAGSETKPQGDNLLDAILATSDEHRVSVKILLNSTLLLDTKRPLVRFLSSRKLDSGLVEVRGISRFPQLLHAKMVILDGRRAFLMGSPFVNGYWDTPSHHPADSRRPRRELGGRPVHDVSLGVHGSVVGDLAQTFARLWNGAAQRGLDHLTPIEAPSVDRSAKAPRVEVVTTAPRGSRRSRDSGSLETLDKLLEGIQGARSMIYIEHQYLSSRPVVHALRRALDRERTLEIILVLNQNPDVTAYRRWQNARLAGDRLLAHPRVGAFALWSAAGSKQPVPLITQVFVHSKVVIIDDEWAMVGSANLDGASLNSYGDDFTNPFARRLFRDVRNFDVSLVLHRGWGSVRAPNPVRRLREQLWAEHFGHGVTGASEPRARARLSTWRAIASGNVAALNRGGAGASGKGSFILPYSTSPTPREQLANVGVLPSAPMRLEFDPGWLEVNFSPNWIRNMFL